MTGSRLEAAVNVCLIATCVLISIAVGQRLWSDDTANAVRRDADYKRGDLLPALDGVRFGDKPKTLLLLVSSRCTFCTESMPFYTKLSTQRPKDRFQLVVVGSESEATLTDYLAKHSVEADRILTIGPGTLKVAATPTIILVDDARRVLGQWTGALRGREDEVEAALAR